MNGFIKLKRSPELEHLVLTRPSAYILLTLIAFRAKRTNERTFNGLEVGEALVGDYSKYLSTRRKYRTDVNILKEAQLITTRKSNRGTIAKLADSSIFDINTEEEDHQEDHQKTTSRPPAGQQEATNKECKNERMKEVYIAAPKVAAPKIPTEFQRIMSFLEETTGAKCPNYPKQAKAWKQMKDAEYTETAMCSAILAMKKDEFWQKNGFDLMNVMNNISKIKQKMTGGSG